MKPTIQAVRAIGVEFIRRKIRPLVVAGLCAAVLLVGMGVWLVAAVNVWWWLALAPVLMVSVLFIALVLVAQVMLRLADSSQSLEQKRAVRKYVDGLQRVAENVQTPPVIILYRVVRDVVRPGPDGFIATMSRDSQSLAPEFQRLISLF